MSDLFGIASKFGSYLTKTSPQIKDNSLEWYISGSLATTIIASADSITEVELDDNNIITGEQEIKKITDEQREKLKTFERKLGVDIDVVNVNGDLFSGAPIGAKPHIKNVTENVPEILDLMSWNSSMGGSMYIDNLESERDISNHSVVKVVNEHGEFYVTAPPELLAHKLHELVTLKEMINQEPNETIEKNYKKDIKDFSTMFYGFKDLYNEKEFKNRIYKALCEKEDSEFSVENQDLDNILNMINQDSRVFLREIAGEKEVDDMDRFLGDLSNKRIIETAVDATENTREGKIQEEKDTIISLEMKNQNIDKEADRSLENSGEISE